MKSFKYIHGVKSNSTGLKNKETRDLQTLFHLKWNNTGIVSPWQARQTGMQTIISRKAKEWVISSFGYICYFTITVGKFMMIMQVWDMVVTMYLNLFLLKIWHNWSQDVVCHRALSMVFDMKYLYLHFTNKKVAAIIDV